MGFQPALGVAATAANIHAESLRILGLNILQAGARPWLQAVLINQIRNVGNGSTNATKTS